MVSFKLFIRGDRRKILNVDAFIERWKEMEKLSMQNITDSNVWKGNIIVPCSQQFTKYYFLIEVDSTFYLNFGALGRIRLREKSKVYDTITFESRRESSSEIQLAFCENTGKEEGYFSLCYDILKSANSGNELECMTQMKQMEDISVELDEQERKNILKRMIRIVQNNKLTKSINCAVFVSFLLHTHRSLHLEGIMPCQFAKTIMNGVSSINIGYIPKAQQGAFIDVLKKIYTCADSKDANYLSFCKYLYPCFGADICCELLSGWESSKEFCYLVPQDNEKASRILYSLVDAIFRQWGSFKEKQLLCEIQQSLSLNLQTKLLEFSSNKVDLPVTATDILQSTCKKELHEISQKGEMVDIITKWYEISNCCLLDTDEIREMTEKSVLECIDKANESQIENSYGKLKDLCLFGKLFMKNSKIQLLQKFITSDDDRIHSLLPLCLKEERYQDIPNDDMDNIVLKWFDHAFAHFCTNASKENDLPTSLRKLYTYVAEILRIDCLQSNEILLTKLRGKAFEYLKYIDIVEVVKAVPHMERLDCLHIEDLFRDHMRKLFNEALKNQDITRDDLFCHTKTCVVDNR